MAAGPIKKQSMDNRLRIAQATIIKDMKINMGIDVLSYEALLRREQEYLQRMTEAMDRIQHTDTNINDTGTIPTIDISNEQYNHRKKEEEELDTDDEIDRMIEEEEAEEEMRRIIDDEEEEEEERDEKGAEEA